MLVDGKNGISVGKAGVEDGEAASDPSFISGGSASPPVSEPFLPAGLDVK